MTKRRRLSANIAGWIFGAVVGFGLVTPFILEAMHRTFPVYAAPTQVTLTCDAATRTAIITGVTRKLDDFGIVIGGPVGYLLIEYEVDGIVYPATMPLIAPDGAVVATRPRFVAGDEFVIGPFIYPSSGEGRRLSVSVKLPGYRFSVYDFRDAAGNLTGAIGLSTVATIGPMDVRGCTF